MFLKMAPPIKASGSTTRNVAKAYKSGLTAHAMMACGKMEWLAGMGDSYTQKGMSILASGLKIRPTGMEFILTSTVADTKANGTKTNNTATAKKSGSTAPSTKATMKMASNAAKASLSGPTIIVTRANF